MESELTYLKTLVGAGVEGISNARRELDGRVFTPPLIEVVWMPVAFGAALGAVSSWMTGRRKPSDVAAASVVGSLVGFGVVLGWTSRHFAGRAARDASNRVGATRDARWLAKNPIDYA